MNILLIIGVIFIELALATIIINDYLPYFYSLSIVEKMTDGFVALGLLMFIITGCVVNIAAGLLLTFLIELMIILFYCDSV